MAAIGSTQSMQFVLPISDTPFYNRNHPWSSITTHSIHPFKPSVSQKTHKAAATPSLPSQIEAGGNTAARAGGCRRSPADDESDDDDFPSFNELSRPALHSTEASDITSTLQRPEEQALDEREQLGSGQYAGRSRDQPVILDTDDATSQIKGVFGDVDTRRIGLHASLPNTLPTSKLALVSTESTDAPRRLYNVEDGCYIEEPISGLGPHELRRMPFALAQARPKTIYEASQLSQDQSRQQSIGRVTRSTSVESALHYRSEASDTSDNGWTDENIAELEKELGLVLGEQQVEPTSTSTAALLNPCLVEASQDEIQSRERSKTAVSRPEELRDAYQSGTPTRGPDWKQRETRSASESLGEEAITVQIRPQGELAGCPAVSDQQNQAEVGNDATDTLPAAQLEIDKHHFRLRGIRYRQLAGRLTKTTQYRLVRGKHPNRIDSWFNEDDIRILWLPPDCEQASPDLVTSVEGYELRVHRIRSNRCSKGKKSFEYLVGDSRWIPENQLRIPLSPTLVAEPKGSSSYPSKQAQPEVDERRQSAASLNDEYHYTSQASRDSSTPADPATMDEPATRKREHQETHTAISSETFCVNTGDGHDACDIDSEDPQSARRRKRRATPAATPTQGRHTPKLRPRQTRRLVAPSTIIPRMNDTHPKDGHGCQSTFMDSHPLASRISRSPSTAAEAVPVAEYQEWPFQGFLKRTKIGDDATYNLEFKLPSVSELHVSSNPKVMDVSSSGVAAKVPIRHEAAAYSKLHQAALPPKKKRVKRTPEEDAAVLKMKDGFACEENHTPVPHRSIPHVGSRLPTKRIPWTEKEDKILVQMKRDGCSWEEICEALPHRTPGAIQVHYSTEKLGSRIVSRKRRRR